MEQRFNMAKTEPEAYRAMAVLDKLVADSEIPPLHLELIKIRASQINGCAYCVNHHTRDAKKLGETDQRIFLLPLWHEATNVFTDEERILFEMTEQITLINKHGLSDELYAKAIEQFGNHKTALIIMAIIAINGWNRIGISLKMLPQL